MQAIFDVPAPAKLNLFLHVTGRRADGHHLLQSVFMLVDWCDTLHFTRRAGRALTREDLGAPLPADDLVLRAAAALQRATGCGEGAHIAVDKRIPAEAGMGGGSSDAASCLLALNRLWQLGLPLPALAKIGLGLGADVPFFLHGHNAWVEGVGERITPLAGATALPRAEFLVVKPAAGLSTAAVFAAARIEHTGEPATISGFAANAYAFGRNDLQAAACRLCPELEQALQWLEDQGLRGRMTGSGSAVFAQVPAGFQPAEAPAAWQVRRCSNLAAHPLVGWAVSGM